MTLKLNQSVYEARGDSTSLLLVPNFSKCGSLFCSRKELLLASR